MHVANVDVIRAGEEQKLDTYASAIERIYFEWDKALGRNAILDNGWCVT
jgi:hypothetical protein